MKRQNVRVEDIECRIAQTLSNCSSLDIATGQALVKKLEPLIGSFCFKGSQSNELGTALAYSKMGCELTNGNYRPIRERYLSLAWSKNRPTAIRLARWLYKTGTNADKDELDAQFAAMGLTESLALKDVEKKFKKMLFDGIQFPLGALNGAGELGGSVRQKETSKKRNGK